MYEVYESLRNEKGVRNADVCKAIGVSQGVISDWKSGRYNLKPDKLKKIADYFGVSVDFLMTGKETERESMEGKKYYFDDLSAQRAQEMHENKKLGILHDAVRKLKPEALDALITFVNTQLELEDGRK